MYLDRPNLHPSILLHIGTNQQRSAEVLNNFLDPFRFSYYNEIIGENCKNDKHLSVIPQKLFIIVEVTMKNISLALICFSALSFALAVFVAFQGPFLGIPAEGFSRGCSNMALICIALLLWRQAFANE